MFRRLNAFELEYLTSLQDLLAEMRVETLEMLAISKDEKSDVFLKAKAQALLDLAMMPDMQRSIDLAEKAQGEGDHNERRPDDPPGWWVRFRRGLRTERVGRG